MICLSVDLISNVIFIMLTMNNYLKYEDLEKFIHSDGKLESEIETFVVTIARSIKFSIPSIDELMKQAI